MRKPVVFMFSGQGSQYFQMGKELYESHPRFALWMNHCDELVHPLIGRSLIDILYNNNTGKSHPFDRILYTNPALLCFEYSLARVLMESNIRPEYLLGYSLGEFCSSVLSGVISLENAIELLVEFSKLLEQTAEPASMMAIIDSEILMEKHPEWFDGCWLASRNFSKNFVVSGHENNIHRLQQELAKQNIVAQKLNVRYGFHSCMMDSLKEGFYSIASRFNYCSPSIPIISARTGTQVNYVDENHLWDVIRQTVEFDTTIVTLIARDDYIFIDVGPSGTLATFVKYVGATTSGSQSYEVINPFGRDIQTLEKLMGAIATEFII